MSTELALLSVTAATLGVVHTLLGPDHYIPFVAMAKAGRWSWRKTALVTSLCGLGHVGSSVLLGWAAILGWSAVSNLEWFESFRGDLAGWLLVAFGAAYTLWGLRRAWRTRPHTHAHVHADGTMHDHRHAHDTEHGHPHTQQGKVVTPWLLFLIFVLGPCEPLIPLLMYPAAAGGAGDVAVVTVVFALATIGTMLAVVGAGIAGLSFLPSKGLERYTHALAGVAVLLCGVSVQFLGL